MFRGTKVVATGIGLCLHLWILPLVPAVSSASPAIGLQKVSLKKYELLSIPVPNPMEMAKLPRGKTYQVSHPHFVLQFFFTGTDIYGIIFKRDKKYSLFLRWCFFRSCEESKYDYKVMIAKAFDPPFDQDFFMIRLPVKFSYKFQGLDFTTSK